MRLGQLHSPFVHVTNFSRVCQPIFSITAATANLGFCKMIVLGAVNCGTKNPFSIFVCLGKKWDSLNPLRHRMLMEGCLYIQSIKLLHPSCSYVVRRLQDFFLHLFSILKTNNDSQVTKTTTMHSSIRTTLSIRKNQIIFKVTFYDNYSLWQRKFQFTNSSIALVSLGNA